MKCRYKFLYQIPIKKKRFFLSIDGKNVFFRKQLKQNIFFIHKAFFPKIFYSRAISRPKDGGQNHKKAKRFFKEAFFEKRFFYFLSFSLPFCPSSFLSEHFEKSTLYKTNGGGVFNSSVMPQGISRPVSSFSRKESFLVVPAKKE